MKRVIVRYRVKQDHQQENEDYIRKVFAELKSKSPAGLRYASFRAADSPIFFHIASVETESGENPLTQTEAFKAFTAKIGDRCDEPPVTTELEEIGSYNFFG
jgi:quinol monooxygenase YgiN